MSSRSEWRLEVVKKALLCGDCCDRSQAIILVVFGFVSLLYLITEVLWLCVLASEEIPSYKVVCEYIVLFVIEKWVG